MEAAILTVGDEILAGDITNTNASWLASELSDRGVEVRRITTIPDELPLLAETVRGLADAHDAVIVTGGIGGTPDDITIEGVAAAFDRELVIDATAREDIIAHVERVRDRHPDLDVDIDAEAAVPEGARVLLNSAGLSPGCVLANVYVFPGIPSEMKAMFDDVADEFDGERYSRITHTDRPESNIADLLGRVREEFDVQVGSYPQDDGGEKRIKLTASNEDRLNAAYEYLAERLASDDATP